MEKAFEEAQFELAKQVLNKQITTSEFEIELIKLKNLFGTIKQTVNVVCGPSQSTTTNRVSGLTKKAILMLGKEILKLRSCCLQR